MFSSNALIGSASLIEITNTISEGIYVIDNAGLITFANPKACTLLGYDLSEFTGQHSHDLFHQKKARWLTISS